jgi:hypothetical protein
MKLEVIHCEAANCFVKLPPQIVSSIFDQAPGKFSSLALEVSWLGPGFKPQRVAVGWGGEASLAEDVLEVPLELARSIKLPQRQQVRHPLRLHHATSSARIIIISLLIQK